MSAQAHNNTCRSKQKQNLVDLLHRLAKDIVKKL